MFPMVPYHRLPELHEEIKGDLAPAYPSIWAAYRELVPAVLGQLKDQSYYVRRELPPGARPFHEPSTVNDGRALPLLPAWLPETVMPQWIPACATDDVDGRFDYTSGKAMGAPVLVDLRTYPTKVEDGTVYIELA